MLILLFLWFLDFRHYMFQLLIIIDKDSAHLFPKLFLIVTQREMIIFVWQLG